MAAAQHRDVATELRERSVIRGHSVVAVVSYEDAAEPCVLLDDAMMPASSDLLRETGELRYLLAKRLRGFERCNAPQIFCHFIRGKGQIAVTDEDILVRYPKRAHNPLLRSVPWSKLPDRICWLGDRRLRLLLWQ